MRRVMHARTLLLAVAVGACVAAAALAAGFNAWTPAHPLASGRFLHVAVRLSNGDVLVAGGQSTSSTAEASVEIYNPASNAWSAAHDMGTARETAAAVVLASGKVLVVGGSSTTTSGDALDTGEVYDPATNAWTAVTGTMSSARILPIAVLLTNGKVLIAGGVPADGDSVKTADLYDPVQNKFTAAPSMNAERGQATATRLPSGKVLVAGGTDTAGNALDTGEVYDPTANSWTPVGNSMSSPHALAQSALLPNGKVMIAGGLSSTTDPLTTNAVDLYDPSANTFSPGPSMDVAPALFGLTSLADGRVLETGGLSALGPTSITTLHDSEVYSPTANSWSPAGSLPAPEAGLTTTLLQNGEVLGAGGSSDRVDGSVPSELFTPSAKPTAPLLVSASPGNDAATVSFAPPATDGGLPVQHYTITASTGQSTTTPDARTVATVGGLPNGKPITFTVTATNSLGTGAASAATAAVITGPPTVKLAGLKRKLKLKSFLKGVSFSVTPDKAAALQLSLLGTVKRATVARAFNLTLASKSFGLSTALRKVKLVPSKKLTGRPHRGAKVELLIVATDSSGNRSTTIEKIALNG